MLLLSQALVTQQENDMFELVGNGNAHIRKKDLDPDQSVVTLELYPAKGGDTNWGPEGSDSRWNENRFVEVKV